MTAIGGVALTLTAIERRPSPLPTPIVPGLAPMPPGSVVPSSRAPTLPPPPSTAAPLPSAAPAPTTVAPAPPPPTQVVTTTTAPPVTTTPRPSPTTTTTTAPPSTTTTTEPPVTTTSTIPTIPTTTTTVKMTTEWLHVPFLPVPIPVPIPQKSGCRRTAEPVRKPWLWVSRVPGAGPVGVRSVVSVWVAEEVAWATMVRLDSIPTNSIG